MMVILRTVVGTGMAYCGRRQAHTKHIPAQAPLQEIVRHEIVRHEIVRHEIVRHEIVRHEIVRHEIVRHEIVS